MPPCRAINLSPDGSTPPPPRPLHAASCTRQPRVTATRARFNRASPQLYHYQPRAAAIYTRASRALWLPLAEYAKKMPPHKIHNGSQNFDRFKIISNRTKFYTPRFETGTRFFGLALGAYNPRKRSVVVKAPTRFFLRVAHPFDGEYNYK